MNVAIDLDNTLVDGVEATTGAWKEGAVQFVRALRSAGFQVIIHTCRATWDAGGGVKAVLDCLEAAGFEPQLITESWSFRSSNSKVVGVWTGSGKPVACAYVDDRAVQYNPDRSWGDILHQVIDLAQDRA